MMPEMSDLDAHMAAMVEHLKAEAEKVQLKLRSTSFWELSGGAKLQHDDLRARSPLKRWLEMPGDAALIEDTRMFLAGE
jgi:hypothetical protein